MKKHYRRAFVAGIIDTSGNYYLTVSVVIYATGRMEQSLWHRHAFRKGKARNSQGIHI